MNTLHSLPNELAFQIFDDLNGADLFALAKSCRHLNTIAIPYYLSRHDIPDPYRTIGLHSGNFHLLPFLRISVQLTSVGTIYAFLSPRYLDDIRGLEHLVAKLSSVRVVRLFFRFVGPFRNEQDVAQFVHAIHYLLTSIIARSCVSLCVRGPDMYSHCADTKQVRQSRSSKLSSRFIAPLVRMLRKPPPKQDYHDSLLLDTIHAYELAKLRMDLSMLFHPPFLYWVIKLINASPLTTLSLINSSRKPFALDDLLPSIHCPALLEFCITEDVRQISFSSVVAFLARHQSLTSLECKGVLRHDHEHPLVILPRLSRLILSYESVVHLLEDVTLFPSLRHISLGSFPDKYYTPFNPSIVNNALECVRHYPNEVELSLTFAEDEALIAWLDVYGNDHGRAERSLHHVVCLELLFGLITGHLSNETLLALPKWLALFPTLRHLTIRFYLLNERAAQLNFVRSVIQACSQLEVLKVNLESHTVAAWLAMED